MNGTQLSNNSKKNGSEEFIGNSVMQLTVALRASHDVACNFYIPPD